jgi:HSP20 family protein
VQRNVDRLFDEFFNDFAGFGLRPVHSSAESLSAFNPKIDISETEAEIRIAAELPGLDENDIDVSLVDNVLTISGEKKVEEEDEGENYHRIERSYGSFKRSVALSNDIDTEQIDAVFKNGVLTVTLPKTPEAQEEVNKIEIKAS